MLCFSIMSPYLRIYVANFKLSTITWNDPIKKSQFQIIHEEVNLSLLPAGMRQRVLRHHRVGYIRLLRHILVVRSQPEVALFLLHGFIKPDFLTVLGPRQLFHVA